MRPAADVFVAIASYRDPDLPDTLRSLTAGSDARLRVAVISQTRADDDRLRDQVEDAAATARTAGHQVAIIDIDAGEVRGVGIPRAMAAALWQGEPWFLCADSHMTFDPNWPTTMQGESARTTRPDRAILTTYVPGIEAPASPTAMGCNGWGKTVPLFRPRYIAGGAPQPARSVSLHFLWAPGPWLADVPVDPLIHFEGDEWSTALRSMTSGWDLWHPGTCVARHRYDRDGRPTIWADRPSSWSAWDVATQVRLERLIAGADLGVWGLGGARRLGDVLTWSGVDYGLRDIVPDAEWRVGLAQLAPE